MARSVIFATGDTTRVNDTTLLDDPTLVVALAANKTYLIDTFAVFSSLTTINTKVNLQFTGSLALGTSHGVWMPYGVGNPSTSEFNAENITSWNSTHLTDGTTYHVVGNGSWGRHRSYTVLKTTSVGDFKLRWNAGAVHASGATRYAHSAMSVENITDSTGVAFVHKLYDQSIASNTTVAPDNELILPCLSSGVWQLQAGLRFNDGPGGLVVRLGRGGDATAFGSMILGGMDEAATNSSAGYIVSLTHAGTAAFTQSSIQSGATTAGFVRPLYVDTIITLGAAQRISIDWAQFGSNATPTILRAGSWMLARKLN